MNTDFFLEEAKFYIGNCYAQFNAYQKITWGILEYVNQLFSDNKITYYLAYGTLLGAIRDKGQIPWDYDVDIHVKVSDREKLLHVLKTKMSDDYYYVYTDTMPNYPAECLRICKKGYTYMAFHVDVFFLCGCADDKVKRIPHLKMARKWANFRVQKYAYKHDGSLHNIIGVRLRIIWLLKQLYRLVPEKCILNREQKILFLYDINECKYLMSYCFTANWGDNEYEVYPSEIFSSVSYININGVNYPIPTGYDKYLTLLFGNYMNYLPIESRFSEFYNQLKQISYRQKFYEEIILK